jgi:hypothetical protein
MDAIDENSSKHFTSEKKKIAIALWKAKVPQKIIWEQCKMSESTMQQILSHTEKNPRTPVLARKKGTSQTSKITPHTLQQMKEGLRKT